MKYGICHLGVIPVRLEQNHKSELITQLLYGETFKIIDQRKQWFKVRLDWDKYEGWISQNQVHLLSVKEYQNLADIRPKASHNLLDYIKMENDVIFPIPLGADLRGIEVLGHRFEAKQPPIEFSRQALIRTAYLYLHTPYLWGGRTPFGIDCSGLTQMIYKIHGIALKRDAYQQAKQGVTLSFIEESQPGDLAFFDNKEGEITHVGVLLQNHFILHAHGQVRIDRIDQTGIFNVKTQVHTHKFRLIKSIL